MTGRLVAAAYELAWRVVRGLPEPLVLRAFRALADLAWRRRTAGARQLERNLRRVVGPELPAAELAELTRAGLRSYFRYWAEVFRLPSLGAQRIVGGMSMTDEFRLRDAYAAGRGVVLALPHTGNWDQAGAWGVLTGMPFTTVAERLRPASLFDRFVAFRESLGMEVIPLTGGDNPFGVLARRLRAGGMLCLLADRDLTASGLVVDFFGEPARMPAGPAALAVQTGAVLLPTTLHYPPGGGWHARIHPAVLPPPGLPRREQIAAMTQAVADAFAEGIREHPQDWHMLQPLWLADLDPERTARADRAAGATGALS